MTTTLFTTSAKRFAMRYPPGRRVCLSRGRLCLSRGRLCLSRGRGCSLRRRTEGGTPGSAVPCDIPQGDESGCPEDESGCPEDDSGCPEDDSGCPPRRNTGKRRGRRWYLSTSIDSSCGNSRFSLTHFTNLRFGARTYLALCAMMFWGVMTSSGVMGIQSQSLGTGGYGVDYLDGSQTISTSLNGRNIIKRTDLISKTTMKSLYPINSNPA